MMINGKYTSALIYVDNVEQSCLEQISQMVNNEQFTNPIAIMPDCHAGYGSVIGFTMKLGNKLAPNIVGVDIGCGVLAVNLGNNSELLERIGTKDFDDDIRKVVPMGFAVRSMAIDGKPTWFEICYRVGAAEKRAFKSIGTLEMEIYGLLFILDQEILASVFVITGRSKLRIGYHKKRILQRRLKHLKKQPQPMKK